MAGQPASQTWSLTEIGTPASGPVRAAGVDLGGGAQSRLGPDDGERVDLAVPRLDGGERSSDRLGRGQRPFSDGLRRRPRVGHGSSCWAAAVSSSAASAWATRVSASTSIDRLKTQ